jgi:hypothetical protein
MGVLLGLGVSMPMAQAGVPVRMNLEAGGGFDVLYAFSTGQSTVGRDDLSGHILADVDIDAAGRVSRFAFTGGRVAHADTTLEILLNTSFLGTAKVRISLANVVTQPMTNGGQGVVVPVSGALDNADHRMISNEGTITTRYLLGNTIVMQETRNLATQPDNSPLVGGSTVTATLLEETGFWKRYGLSLQHTRDVVRTQVVSGVPNLPAGTTLDIYEVSGFAASGEVVVPGDGFVAWASAFRNVGDADFQTRDPLTGHPLLVMYALGAGSGPWTLPVVPDPASQTLKIQCPVPLRAPLVWEHSITLAPDAWQALAGGRIEQGVEGEQVISLPTAERIFLRASVPVP